MRPLSPDELSELRSKLVGSSASCEKLDELIHILDAVATSFVDQAFGVSAVQNSLSVRANRAFSGHDSCGEVQLSAKYDDEKRQSKGCDSLNNLAEDFSP